MSFKIDTLKKENLELMTKCDELSKLYLDASHKEREYQRNDCSGELKKLKIVLEEEKQKWDLEHKRYVYCKQLVEHQEMEIQKLNIKHEIDLTELRTNHKVEVEKLTK